MLQGKIKESKGIKSNPGVEKAFYTQWSAMSWQGAIWAVTGEPCRHVQGELRGQGRFSVCRCWGGEELGIIWGLTLLERNEQAGKKKEMRSVKYQGLDHGGPWRPLKNLEFFPEWDGEMLECFKQRSHHVARISVSERTQREGLT